MPTKSAIARYKKTFIFKYDSRLSFGPGAEHVSVAYNSKFIYFYTGTPQQPKLTAIYHYDADMIEGIQSLDPCFDNADFIRGKYILPAYWGTNI